MAKVATLEELDGDNAIYSWDDIMRLNALLDMKEDLREAERRRQERQMNHGNR